MSLTRILLFGIFLFATSAQAGVIQENGNFEADKGLKDLEQEFDQVSVMPTGWEYDDYYGYGKNAQSRPKLMNVSGVGNGEGGTVGVSFPNWEDDRGWKAALVQKGPVITPGAYELTTTFTGLGLKKSDDRNWIKSNVYWIDDLLDPWSNDYDNLTDNDYVQLTRNDNGKWQTQTSRFVVEEGSEADGKYLATWIQVKNYVGHIIVGEASLTRTSSIAVPEPGTLLLLMTGLLGLAMLRKDSLLR